MADRKGPEPSKDAKRDTSARPRSPTLDLSAKEVRQEPAQAAAPDQTPSPAPATGAGPKQPTEKGEAKGGFSGSAAESGVSLGGAPKAETPKAETPKPETPSPAAAAAGAASSNPDTKAATAPAGSPKPGSSSASAASSSPASTATEATKPASDGPRPKTEEASAASVRRGAIPSSPYSPPPRSGGVGLLGLAAATLGGAALGVLVVALFGRELLGLQPPDLSRVAAAEAKLDAVGADVAALRDQIGRTAQASDTSAIETRVAELGKTVETAAGRTESLETEVRGLGEKVANPQPDPAINLMAGRLDGLELRFQSTPTLDAVAGLDARLTNLEIRVKDAPSAQALNELRGRIDAVPAAFGEALRPLNERIGAVDAALRARPVGDPAARLVVALGALNQALDAGRPFANELAAVKAAGAPEAAISSLESAAGKGVPTRAALSSELSKLMAGLPPLKSEQTASVFDRFVASAGSVVKVRPADAPQGSEPNEVRMRIAAAAEAGDVEAAFADQPALDEAAKAATAEWADKAKARFAAEKAVADARAGALARLAAND
jgi:hypothetical protein